MNYFFDVIINYSFIYDSALDVPADVRISSVPLVGKVGSHRTSEAVSFLREDGVT